MNKKTKVAAGVAAAVVAAGTAVNVAFDPQELIHSADYLSGHTQIVQAAKQSGETVLATYPDEEHISLADAARGWFIRLPVALKAAILLPLWGVGALPAAIGTALAPVWAQVLGFLAQAGILVGLFCGVYKLLFPGKKLKDLFKRKNLRLLFAGALVITAVNVLLGQLWAGWPVLRTVLVAAAGFGVLCLLWKRLCGKFKAPQPDVVKTQMVLEY